ncbi:hypothetical protein HL658_15775 [Azospirillum sp. RWY-5-1]|uniref:Uncharacterized protein n=1 Tax=Azospirillum oleiclasticum TaxID=2735135 RepID=A0ABX2TEQ1_9PROT|nr:hypothetical protein [Azospirillum oleiclasticum]NYZ14015.1 hypothetical protein [Azospirillum oleiclasticum]NYZ21499.1 hypothetical protein [Azospirillum oleiclasticum]
MFRPIVTSVLALALVVLAGCADAPPQRAGSSSLPPPSEAVPVPATPGAARPMTPPTAAAAPSAGSDLLTDTNRLESCRERCERSYRICGDSTSSSKDDMIGTLGNPRPFSQADDCQYQLRSCHKRCDTTP